MKTATETEAMAGQISLAGRGAAAYETIEDEEAYLRAASLAAKLLELAREANARRVAAKAPYWQKCKEIDSVYMPSISAAVDAARKIREAMAAYLWAKEDPPRPRRARQAPAPGPAETPPASSPAPPGALPELTSESELANRDF